MSGANGPAPVTQDMLDACSREPIHIPGAIQPHGALLVLRGDLSVAQASANAGAWLGQETAQLVEAPLDRVLPSLAEPLRALIAAGPLAEPVPVGEPVPLAGRLWQAVAHRVGPSVLLELEEHDPPGGDALRGAAAVSRATRTIAAATTIAAACQAATDGVHAITAYDRVMAYRFDPEGHGEVVAETVSAGVDSFLGLRYPASDIPLQARAMMQVVRVRVITDSAHTAAPLVPRDAPVAPVDLTRCALRAVSPIHLEYLRNMGVGASLSAAILVEGRLWGLVACQHRGTRDARHWMRAQSEVLASVLGGRITALEHERRLRAQLEAGRLTRAVLSSLSLDQPGDWAAELMQPGRVLPVVNATGAMLWYRGGMLNTGEVPPHGVCARLVAWLVEHQREPLLASDSLQRLLPDLESNGAWIGMLAVRLSLDQPDVLVWFRPEQVRTVAWGGDPSTTGRQGGTPHDRLHPRTSFAAWQETVRGRSHEWSIEDRAAAAAVREQLHEVVRRVYDVKRALARSNSELSQFAHAAAHDLQEPLRTVGIGVDRLLLEVGAFAAAVGQPVPEPVTRIAGIALDGTRRGHELIADLLAFARVGSEREHAPVPMAAAFEDARLAVADTIAAAGATLSVGELPMVTGHRRQLTQLWQNLLSNALKYRGKAAPSVQVEAFRRAGAWEFRVADNGIGIDASYHELVFTIFKRLHGRSEYPGTGVGLAICKKVVEQHGGRIWVESKPGEGATFRFTISDTPAPAPTAAD